MANDVAPHFSRREALPMIESIRIAEEASFGREPQFLKNLSTFNYIYGANGTGKTTISRIIAGDIISPNCTLTWKDGQALTTLVYNRDFVERNFSQEGAIPGIFTLGEHNVRIVTRINALKAELEKLNSKIISATRNLNGNEDTSGKLQELEELEQTFENTCWLVKQKYDRDFHAAFSGARNNRKKFKEKVLEQWHQSNATELLNLDELKEASRTVFASQISYHSHVPHVDFSTVLDYANHELLARPIIGKRDVDVAAIIQKLGNSDWVRAGLKYLRASDSMCPFCQQPTPADLEARLNEYFDETFEKDMQNLHRLFLEYETAKNLILSQLENIIATEHPLLPMEQLKRSRVQLEVVLERNLRLLGQKLSEPSIIVQLESIEDLASTINSAIDLANERVIEHNTKVDNIEVEQERTKAQIWKFLLENELKPYLLDYLVRKERVLKAIEGLKKTISELTSKYEEKHRELQNLEAQTTSVKPTVAAINNLLRSFGFRGFELKEADRDPYYRIIRPDGTDAKRTLSEGEKTFISFLYFYHYLQGSTSPEGIAEDRVVVFDDPISSLDSDVLFIVSSLIRRLKNEVRERDSQIRQIFVLSHNIYFFKEVTWEPRREIGRKLNEETFWILRKHNEGTQIESYPYNPIKTAYELLWDELIPERRNRLTIRNTLRRILETYFTFYGGMDLQDLCDKFEGEDKSICGSLVSWLHDGSHHIDDGLYAPLTDEAVDRYLDVFQRIFEQLGHKAHYEMMMRRVTETAPELAMV